MDSNFHLAHSPKSYKVHIFLSIILVWCFLRHFRAIWVEPAASAPGQPTPLSGACATPTNLEHYPPVSPDPHFPL